MLGAKRKMKAQWKPPSRRRRTEIAKFGTNIKKLKPECGTAKDCIVTPTMGVWTDFSQPRQYTVISGNRQVKKTYTVTITLQGE